MNLRQWFTKTARVSFIIIILVVPAVLLSLQNVCSPISSRINYSDGSIYQYIGHLICEGKMPYLDAFDHKGPVLYLINALSCLWGINGIYWIDFASLLLYAIFSFLIARKYVNEGWALAVSTVSLTALSHSYWIGNTPDYYSSIAILYCFLCFSDYCETSKLSNFKIFSIGMAIAFCFWQKFTTIVVIGVLCIGILLLDYQNNKGKNKFGIRCVIYSILGFSLVSIPILAWLLSRNALVPMIEEYFLFSSVYGMTDVSTDQKISAFLFFLSDPFIAVGIIAAASYLFAAWIFTAKEISAQISSELYKSVCHDLKIVLVCLAGFMTQGFVNALAGRCYVQYKCVLYPCITVIVSVALKFVLILSKNRTVSKVMVAVLMGLLLSLNAEAIYKNQMALQDSHSINEVTEIKKYLTPGDVIAVASPDDCGLYLQLSTESATTYPYIQADLYSDTHFWKEYNDQLISSNVDLVVWNTNWDANYYLPESILTEYAQIDIGRIALFIKNK